MTPTLSPGDQIAVVKIPDAGIGRNDLVAIRFPHRPSMLIKRVIAVPGDRVEVRDERILVNGADRGPVLTTKMSSTLKQLERSDNIVPPQNLFVLGDNRTSSRDSQRLGLIPFSLVEGVVTQVVQEGPLVKEKP